MSGTERVGFIGIGNMGAPMVANLAAQGRRVTIFDVRKDVLQACADKAPGVEIAASGEELARTSTVVITMVPDSKVVTRILFGADGAPGIAGHVASGSVVVDMSSSFPLDTRATGARLAERGIAMVDAPVSGGVPRAITGTLAIMAGGEASAVARMAPILGAMGTVHRTGALGSGHAMKALNNYLSAASLVATAEAMVIGETFGLDPEVMATVFNASTGRSNTTENKVMRHFVPRTYNSGFTLALLDKDVAMARRLATDLAVPARDLAFLSKFLGEALAALGPDADHTAVHAYVATPPTR